MGEEVAPTSRTVIATNLYRIDAYLGLRYFEDPPKWSYQLILVDEAHLNKPIVALATKAIS
jgi:hypothetical protein